MKNKTETTAYNEYISVAKSITLTFISVLLFVLPLVITNGYYNITETKLITFYILSVVYLLVQLFVFFIFIISKRKDFLNSLSFKLNFLDIAFILFGVSYIVSGIFSLFGSTDTLLGTGSRYQGILTTILYILIYFVLTRTFSFSPKCLVWAGIGFSVVSIIAVLNGLSVDPLGIYLNLSPENKNLYISTIGNINFYSAYYNLLLPVFVVGFCKAVDKKALIAFGSFVVMGSLGLVFTASESFLFGFLISMLILLTFFIPHKHALKRFLFSCCLFLFTTTLYTHLYRCNFPKNTFNFSPSGLMHLISNPIVILILLLLFALLLAIATKKPDKLHNVKKIYCTALVIAFSLGIIGVIAINTVFKTIDLGVLNDYLKFSPKWGTNRGQNWIFCIREFINAPLIYKLFGYGPETYYHLTKKAGFYVAKSLDQAHNEYLQYLISVGILGLSSYLCIIFGTVKKCLKHIHNNPVATGILCSLIAYWVQATVNIAQPFTTPIMFIFIAVLSKLTIEKPSQQKKSWGSVN